MKEIIFNAYISSVMISAIFSILYLLKFNRIAKVYNVVDNEEGMLITASIMDWLILCGESFIPFYNLYIGFDAFVYGLLVTDKEFLVDIFKLKVGDNNG